MYEQSYKIAVITTGLIPHCALTLDFRLFYITVWMSCRYYSVVWCKLSRKKHKNWEGDAVLIVKGRSVTLKVSSEIISKRKE